MGRRYWLVPWLPAPSGPRPASIPISWLRPRPAACESQSRWRTGTWPTPPATCRSPSTASSPGRIKAVNTPSAKGASSFTGGTLATSERTRRTPLPSAVCCVPAAPTSWAATCSVRSAVSGTRSGRAGGGPTRPTTRRCSSSPITLTRRSRWRAGRRFTSSPMDSTPPMPRLARLPAQRASTSRAVPRPSARRCWRASSTSSGSTSPPFCSGPARGYSTALPSSVSSPSRCSIPRWRHTSATAGGDEGDTPGSRPNPLARSVLLRKQLPVPLGYDVDGAVDDLDGGLIVDRIRRTLDAGGPSLCVGHGVLGQELVIQVGEDREVDDAQRAVVPGGRLPADEVLPDAGGHHHAPGAQPRPHRVA